MTNNNPFSDIYIKEEFPDHLCQGDIIIGYSSDMIPTFKPENSGIIILSETCDLVNEGNITYISFSPIYHLDVFTYNAIELIIEKKGKDHVKHEQIIETITNKLFKVANYEDKKLFFLTPSDFFGGSPAFSSIEQISHIPIGKSEEIAQYRKASLKSPWREKLAFKTGYLFNRVATPTPDRAQINGWVEEIYGSYIDNILKSE